MTRVLRLAIRGGTLGAVAVAIAAPDAGRHRPAVSGALRPRPAAGLCDRCRHQQVVSTTRGTAYSLCRRSRDQPERFPRYPRLPVESCPGFEPPGATEGEADPGR